MNNKDERYVHHVLGLLSMGNVDSRVIEATTSVITTTHHLLKELLGSTTLSVKL